MPTFMLDGGGEVELGRRPLTISLATEPPGLPVHLEAVSGGEPLTDVVRPRPDILILRDVQDVVTVRALPAGSNQFPAHATLHVDVSVGEPANPDPERAVCLPLDVAGLGLADILIIEPDERVLRVRAARVFPLPTDLGTLGNAARVAATRALGLQSVDDAEARTVTVAVDGSASMRPFVDDGSVATVVGILEGIAQVIAPGRPVLGAVVGLERKPLAAQPGALGDAVTRQLRTGVPSTGFRASSCLPGGVRPDQATATYIVTDSVPPDLEELARRGAVDDVHLVVLGSRAVRRLTSPAPVPSTLVEVFPETTATPLADRLDVDRSELEGVVTSLVSSVRPSVRTPAEGAR